MAGLDAQVQMRLIDLTSKIIGGETYKYHPGTIKEFLERFDKVYKALAKTAREEN